MTIRRFSLIVILFLSLSYLLIFTCCFITPTDYSPNANFSADLTSGKAPFKVSFNASDSSDPDGSIISYGWSFCDGNSGSGISIDHTYKSSGTFPVQLTVTDDDGASSVATKTISVSNSNLSPPSWIIGEWSDENDVLNFTFTSNNVVYKALNTTTVNFSEVADNYYASESSSTSFYSIIVPPEAWPETQGDQDITLKFDKVSSTELAYSTSMGLFTLYKK